ncbi:MAG TPA: beta-ketoacyl-ACP synthase III [Candidatus Limnocylindria bacterium]|jgi:3-oxoacyl-[acyl-carrier-protein] synthase-3
MSRAVITGWGMYAPSRVMTNEDLSKIVDTSDEWIRTRTGIRERRIAADDETTTTLATNAGRDALAVAGVDPADVDLVIVATASPDYLMPATGVLVARDLGATRAAGFDLNAACSGFVFGLAAGASFVTSGMARQVLVIGVDLLSRYLDWTDRNTCVLFGDGAGAVLLSASDGPGGLLSVELYSDGTGEEGIIIPGGGTAHPATEESVRDRLHFMQMAGKEVYRYATRQLADTTQAAVTRAGLRMDDIDLFLYHQANIRILETVRDLLRIDGDKVHVNIDRYGNTSAASVPMALAEAVAAGRVNIGDRILMGAFGAGYTAGAAVLEWTADPSRAFLAPGEQTRAGQPQREPVGAGVE